MKECEKAKVLIEDDVWYLGTYVPFHKVPILACFICNGVAYVKWSTRTGRVETQSGEFFHFYFKKFDRCFIVEA
jgi:hypothetical protein